VKKIFNKFLRIVFGIFIITTGFSGVPNIIWADNPLLLQTNQNQGYLISTEQSNFAFCDMASNKKQETDVKSLF
jgi:hypothetical protein